MGANTDVSDTKQTKRVVTAQPLRGLRRGCELASDLKIFAIFFFVGTGCGWFGADAIWQIVTNEKELQNGGEMFGTLSMAGSIAGLIGLALYFLLIGTGCVKLSLKAQQYVTWLLLVLTVINVGQLAFTWELVAPTYPMVIVAYVLGTLVANATYFIVFPLITTHYGGWIIAPVRTGTDISSLITSLFAEAQNPTGARNLFPTRTLLLIYAGICSMGLLAWWAILHFNIGLRTDEASDEAEVHSTDLETAKSGVEDTICVSSDSDDGANLSGILACKQWVLHQVRGFACPRDLLLPIVLATLTEASQWALLVNFGPIGAKMTDPSGCDGDKGAFVYRTALTVNRVMVPLGSFLSSLASCPRYLFYAFSVVQFVATALLCCATFGVAHDTWTTSAGQVDFVIIYGLIGGFEGYLLTMAYRYIGDSGVSEELRKSSSQLLSFAGILAMTIPGLIFGYLVNNGTLACRSI